MNESPPKKVRMFVFNNCANDARVLKEATTLSNAGFSVEIMALLDAKTVPHEERNGFSIRRIQLNPIHLRLIRFFGNPIRYILDLGKKRAIDTEKKKEATGVVAAMRKWNRNIGSRISSKYDVELVDNSLTHQSNRSYVRKAILTSPLMLVQVFFFALAYIVFRFFYYVKNVSILVITRLAKIFIQKPVRWLLLPFHKYFMYYSFYTKAKAISIEEPADVYHCHDLNTLKIGIELKKVQKCKLVYDSHELYLHKNRLEKPGWLKRTILTSIEKEGMKAADAVITVGPCIADWLAEHYKTNVPHVIYNAPQYREEVGNQALDITLRQALDIPEDRFLVVYSGGITFNRGLENVIKAVSQIEGIHFVMLGYGSEAYLASLKELIVTEKAEKKIDFFGPVPHHEVAAYLTSADVGIAPIMNICLSYYFCAPNKLFEFVQARLPVLASNFPEMQRVVNEFDLGLTFEPADVSSIIKVIESMRDNPEQREKYRANTHSAAKSYNWAVEEAKLQEIYSHF